MTLKSYVALWCIVAISSSAQLFEKSTSNEDRLVKYLAADEKYVFSPMRRQRGFFEREMCIYCYRGEPKTLARLFETIEFIIEIEGDDYKQYDGATPEEVEAHYEEHRSLFSFNLFNLKRTRIQLSPFKSSCLGIESIESYRIHLQKVRVDFWRVIQLITGCLVFLYGGKLSKNVVFYYITGVCLGICTSFMLIIWLASKLVPRRYMMYGVLAGGSVIGLYFIQLLWENLQVIISTYRTYVLWYIALSGVVSFFICYRWGPPTNQRSKNIIKWLLQLMSLVIIYFSSRYEEATIAMIIIICTVHYFPRVLWYKCRAFWLRKFPPIRRLLTEDEYYDQGVRETTKSLVQLRKFVRSPDCNQWRLISRLRDPMRFAAFVEGASHLRDEEVLRFESTSHLYDSEEENNRIQHPANYYPNEDHQNSDISEDDDRHNNADKSTGRLGPSSNALDPASTSANASLARQMAADIAPRIRGRHSLSVRSATRIPQKNTKELRKEK